jgi:very-short-patch-repair endonuclease
MRQFNLTQNRNESNSPLPLAGEGLGERVSGAKAAEDESERKARLLTNAKTLRTHQTETEQRLWYHLRAHRFMDLKFKRQKPIGRFIVDFVCEEHRLIIELDGGQHSEQAAYDQQQDAWLRGQGYTVLRFWNIDVMQNLEGVLEQIRITIALTLSPSPSPASGRGELKPEATANSLGEVRKLRDDPLPQSPRPLAGEG